MGGTHRSCWFLGGAPRTIGAMPGPLSIASTFINWIWCILLCREAYGEDRRERLTTSDALSYLREVKTRFANNRKIYDRWDLKALFWRAARPVLFAKSYDSALWFLLQNSSFFTAFGILHCGNHQILLDKVAWIWFRMPERNNASYETVRSLISTYAADYWPPLFPRLLAAFWRLWSSSRLRRKFLFIEFTKQHLW